MHHVPGFWLCNSWCQQSSLKYTIGYNDQCRGTGNPSRDLTDVSLPGIHFGTIIIKNINETKHEIDILGKFEIDNISNFLISNFFIV